jgi:hypothetical protein
LVALVILSSALTLSLAATQSARKVAAQAAQIRQAEALCRYVLASGSGVAGVTSGRSAGLTWRLEVSPVSNDRRSPESGLCEAVVVARADGQPRAFTLSTTVACRQETAA